ncbi:MAG: copper homeostasis periplasmic binding protein CopC [Caulobacteraceae bacterium]
MKAVTAALALMLAFGFAAKASAHAKLVKSDPAEKGQPTDKKTLELTFNEEISGKLSGAELKDAKGAKVTTTAMVDQNNKGLMVMAKEPLKAGDYKLAWHAVASDDGHRTTGTLTFSVK